MGKKERCIGVAAIAAFFVLIIDTKTSLAGVAQGIDICIYTLIPSLFPFLIISALISSTLTATGSVSDRILCRLFHIPNGASVILTMGLLGGYPVGAKMVTDAYNNGQLSKSDAQRMICFVNNAGPSFIFGMVALSFSSPIIPWLLWLIQIISAWIVSFFFRTEGQHHIITARRKITIDRIVKQAVNTMAVICAWVIIFRTVLSFLSKWFLWLVPASMQVLITGIMELANGCVDLAYIQNESLRFIVAAGMLSFGGLCVMMQTTAVSQGLSVKRYFPGKVLQSIISTALACIMQMLFFKDSVVSTLLAVLLILVIFVIACALVHLKKKKTVAIRQELVYNGQKQRLRNDYAVSKKDPTLMFILQQRHQNQ